MNTLKVALGDQRDAFQPADTLSGAVGWELDPPPEALELKLIWYTRGKGTEDVGVVDTLRLEPRQASGAQPFKFQLPTAPYSFSGRLISLVWAVELVALPSKDVARVEFVMGPGGKEVILESK